MAPVEVDPNSGTRGLIYGIDIGASFADQWAGVISWDFGVKTTERIGFGVGMQYFFTERRELKPYASSRFLYVLDPENAVGWRFNVGVEWDLVRMTKQNNLRLYAESGASQIFPDVTPTTWFVEMIRAGLAWNF